MKNRGELRGWRSGGTYKERPKPLVAQSHSKSIHAPFDTELLSLGENHPMEQIDWVVWVVGLLIGAAITWFFSWKYGSRRRKLLFTWDSVQLSLRAGDTATVIKSRRPRTGFRCDANKLLLTPIPRRSAYF